MINAATRLNAPPRGRAKRFFRGASFLLLLVYGLMLAWSVVPLHAAEIQVDEVFAAQLEQAGLVFDRAAFKDFLVAPVEKNRQFAYGFALKHRALPIEMRFAVHRLPDLTAQQAIAYALTAVLNMAAKEPNMGAGILTTKRFPPDGVKAEFNADWGTTTVIEPDTTFAKYGRGQVIVIYRDSAKALSFWIFLSHAESWGSAEVLGVLRQVIYALRFKN